MLKNLDHMKRVQQRRAASGKRGHSKAVRRFLKGNFPEDYQKIKGQLPANW